MRAVQPCDFSSSPVASNIFLFSQPTTPLAGPPALVHSVWLASKPNCKWCVGKHVLISVNWPVFGSYMARWRLDCSSGNSCADGWADPFLQKAGLAGGRTLEVNQTRPCSSNIGLCMLAWLSQMTSSPQYGDGVMGFCAEEGV